MTGSKEFLLKVPSMASPVVTSVSGNEKLLMANIPAKHCLVYNEGMKARHCGYCKMMRSKTSCGWHVKSYYRCPACDVALCSGKRNCYNEYHKMLNSIHPGLVWSVDDKPIKKFLRNEKSNM